MIVCINCNILLRPPHQLYEYLVVNLSPDLLSIIEEWCAREVTDADHLCQECVSLVSQEAANRIAFPGTRSHKKLGHLCVCIYCGMSLATRSGRRRCRLPITSKERRYVENKIFPRQVPDEAWTCSRCWHIVSKNSKHLANGPGEDEADNIASQQAEDDKSSSSSSSTDSEANSLTASKYQQPDQDIILPNYTRTSSTSSRCFVPDCSNLERRRVPKYLQRYLLKNYKVYVTPDCRVCQKHIVLDNWDVLYGHNFLHSFTTVQIESMLELLSSIPNNSVIQSK